MADLVNVLGPSPSKAAGVIAAENIEGGIIGIGPRGANHFHEHRISIFLLCNAGVTHCVQDKERYEAVTLAVSVLLAFISSAEK